MKMLIFQFYSTEKLVFDDERRRPVQQTNDSYFDILLCMICNNKHIIYTRMCILLL